MLWKRLQGGTTSASGKGSVQKLRSSVADSSLASKVKKLRSPGKDKEALHKNMSYAFYEIIILLFKSTFTLLRNVNTFRLRTWETMKNTRRRRAQKRVDLFIP